MLKPFVKWAGGKRQIIDIIIKKIEESTKFENEKSFRFIEPFVGGGVVFLTLQNKKTIINDLNFELMTTYKVIRDNPEELMNLLDEYYDEFIKRGAEFYYEMRKKDRDENFKKSGDLLIAARMIFLNKTCYNGLYRVNASGYFNTPIGRNSIKSFYDRKNISNISEYLKNNDVIINNGSYEEVLDIAGMGDVVYIDPPYDYKEDDGFTKYQKAGFSFDDFIKLKTLCDKALERGAYIIISNNYTEKVVKEFRDDNQHSYEVFDIMNLATKRSINCKATLRNNGEEILIWGIPCSFPYVKNIESLFPFIKIRKKENISDFDYLKERFGKKYTYKRIMLMVSALKFLKIIDNRNEFTEDGLKLRKLKTGSDEFKKEFAQLILHNQSFLIFRVEKEKNWEWELSIDQIIKILQKKYGGISETSAKKKAEIIDIWIRWAIDVSN